MEQLTKKHNLKNTILHTDRGSQFRSNEMKIYCEKEEIIQSMTDGYALWQNAIVESFFKTIKTNYYRGYKFESQEAFLDWMNLCFINYFENRIHSKIKSTPKEKFQSSV